MIRKYFSRSPFIAFLPFLVVYILYVLKFHSDDMFGDEFRYVRFAGNLLKGFYSPPPPNINLWNGPGYPIVLMPFVALKLPLIAITLFNALLHYLSVCLLFLTIKKYTSFNKAVAFSLFFACYYLVFEEMHLIYTEVFTTFLITFILYCFSKSTESLSKKYLIITGLLFGFLVLTKVVFSYILLFSLAAAVFYFLWVRTVFSKRLVLCLAIAFLLNVPYLIYTYSLTHKIFYWGNSGGAQIYWMSTPYKGEFGDWHSEIFSEDCGNEANPDLLPCSDTFFTKMHGKDMEYITSLTGVAKDDAYKKLAIENIKAHPFKYLRNIFSNFGRLFFNYPFTYTYQKDSTLVRFPVNCIIFVFMLLSIVPTLLNWREFPPELRSILLLLLCYTGLSLLVSAYSRQLTIVVPVFLLWFAYVFNNTIKLNLRFRN